jgi:hypothetical protein
MKRMITLFLSLVLTVTGAFAQDFAATERLHSQRKLDEELALLKQPFSPVEPQAAIVYRVLRCLSQKAADLPAAQRRERIAVLDGALDFAKPLAAKAVGSARDRAAVYSWYAACLCQKGQVQGVLNSLLEVPEVRRLCDRSISIDPGFGDPYYLKARLDEALPELAGGDKARMGELFAKALACDPSDLWNLCDFAQALRRRGKDAEYNRDGKKGVPSGSSDLGYARELAKQARTSFAAIADPSVDQRKLIADLEKAGL